MKTGKGIARLAVGLLACALFVGLAPQAGVLSYAAGDGPSAAQTMRGAASSVTTEPKANVLTYTAEPQKLVTEGVASGGTMQYAISDNGTSAPSYGWSAEVPEETDADTYYVWYKAAGDGGDSEPACITVSIAKRKLIIKATDRTYDFIAKNHWQGPGDIVYEDPAQVAEAITVQGLQGSDTVASVIVDGQGDVIGRYPLMPTSAMIVSGSSGETVSDNYIREYVDGTLRIVGVLEVVVTGSSVEKTYNGKEQTYEGTVTATSKDERFDASKFRYVGNTVVRGTEPGEYTVSLEPESCAYDDDLYRLECTSAGSIKLTIKPTDESADEPAAKTIGGVLLAKMTAKGKKALVLTWNKVAGVDGYDIFFVKCSKSSFKKVKTIKGNKVFKWTKKGLKAGKPYKAHVKAWVKKDGKKKYVKKSLAVHAYASGSSKTCTNAKGVSVKKARVALKKGKTHKIKAKVVKLDASKKLMPSAHTPKLRYVSSNESVAKVSASGKISARAKGSCKIYAVASNGARKTIKLTVT